MQTQYMLFIVLSDIKKFKSIKKKLVELDYKKFTIVDTMGSMGLNSKMEFSRMLFSAIGGTDKKKYNKMIFLAVESDKEVVKLMDEIEIILNLHDNKLGKGIMFTIPIVKAMV